MTTPYQPGYPERGESSVSLTSDSPLHPTDRPPLPSQQSRGRAGTNGVRHVQLPDDTPSPFTRNYETERAMMYPDGLGSMPLPPSAVPDPPSAMPDPNSPSSAGHSYHSSRSRNNSRNGSWDLLAGLRKFEHSYEEFDARNASAAHLAFADGDTPKNRVRLALVFMVWRTHL